MNWNELFANYKSGLGTSLDSLFDNNNDKLIAKMDDFEISYDGHTIAATNKAFVKLKIGNRENTNYETRIALNFINNKDNRIAILVSLQADKENISDNHSDYITKSGDGCIWRKDADKINDWNLRSIQKRDYYKKYFTPGNDGCRLKYVGKLEGAKVEFIGSEARGRFHAIIPLNDYDKSLTNDFNLEETKTIPADVLYLHAKAILARAIFLLGWHIFKKTKFDLYDSQNNLANHNELFPNEQENNQEIKIQLNPTHLFESAKSKGLHFSRPLLHAVCISINLGRHVILTGAPGSGKSKLAELICQEISTARGLQENEGYRIVTASPAWTSGDVIGRYFPNHKNIIKFMPGFFLQAIRDDECLIIDEINRANIDECFGELFTVLAGQTVTLPFREHKDDGSAGEDEKIDEYSKLVQVTIIPLFVKIVVTCLKRPV